MCWAEIFALGDVMNATLTAIQGILVGHATDQDNTTGCTAVLCPEGFTPGVSVPGFAPGSRETELLRPHSPIEAIHGIMLSGGSAFGLAAADGTVQFLREQGHGRATTYGLVPLVAGAVVYDLDVNAKPGTLPDAAMGYAAAAAAHGGPVEQGRVGAGTGVSCGRLFRIFNSRCSMPAGLASCLEERKGIQVAALVVVNALGNVHDPETGAWIAGGRDISGKPYGKKQLYAALNGEPEEDNTMLVIVATNVPLDKAQTGRLAHMAGTGIARCIRPAHLTRDGDVVFALASRRDLPSGTGGWSESLLGAMGAEAVAKATVSAVKRITGNRDANHPLPG